MAAEPTIEVETVAGRLLLHRDDQVITPVLQRWGMWEPGETRFLLSTLIAGQTFVDVGANVGYFSVLAAGRVGPGGSVIAIEPELRNLELLRQNLERNDCTNAVVLPVAAAAAAGRMSLVLDEENRGAHRIAPAGEAATGVECVRLDDVLPARVDVVKIDAQGYDHEVIDGLERTLTANRHAIVVAELSLTELARRGIDPVDVVDGYRSRGFTISTCDDYGRLVRASGGSVVEDGRTGRRPSEISLVLQQAAATRDCPAKVETLQIEETYDGLLVVDPTVGRAHRLNQTAAMVLELCSGENTCGQIAEAVRIAYGLSEAPTDEIDECVAHLRSEGLVT